jgi:phage terminase large subunit
MSYEKIKFPNITEVRLQRMLRLLRTGEPQKEEWFCPNAMLPIFSGPARWRVCYGGRGAGRSWTFVRVLLIYAAVKKLHILCAREFQNSIEESVHQLLSNQIEILGLSNYYEIKKREIVSSCGSDFVFAGLRTNVSKMQSFEGCDICYIEEAAKISKNSWEKLIPTIRKPGSEIWASFNPDLEEDETYDFLVKKPPVDEGLAIVKTTWKDNPWFTDVLRRAKDYMARVDVDAYEHVWGGGCRKNSASQILRNKYIIESFSPGADWHGPYFGVDWGFSQDPTVMIRFWIHGTKLYIEHEAYQIGCETINLPRLFAQVPDGQKHVSRADNARPETISHMQLHGYPAMVPCEKWSGSVEDGVTHLRSYEQIVIHPRCEHTAEEAKLYSYKVDRLTGNVLSDIVDAHNHCWDAIRYGLGPLIRKGGAEAFLTYLQTQSQTDAAKAVRKPSVSGLITQLGVQRTH